MDFLNSLGIEPEIIEGYEDENPLEGCPSNIILSGVPISADYSLAENDTKRDVNSAFGWLKECNCPVLGICYGHQILAQIFGGNVSSMKGMLVVEKLPLVWKADAKSGILSDVENLVVSAEHRDYVSEIPQEFTTLCQIDEIPYVMYHSEREMYGVQFIPEHSDERSKELLKRFVSR